MIKQAKKGFTLIELMIVVAIIGILAAIAIPNFIKFQARSKQSEVKANLKAVYTAQKAYMQEKDKYSGFAGDIGFAPERGNRYAYYISDTTGCTDRSGTDAGLNANDPCIEVDSFRFPEVTAGTGVAPSPTTAPAVATAIPYTFTASAAGNIDNDSGLDTWFISSESGTCDGDNNSSGTPCNDLNDV